MGCSPSHALIINSPSAQETICLQPRIFMVSESTLCLLQDVGELRVYRVDDRNPETALEKFKGAQDQLQNPLLFHPHLRSRAGPGPSSLHQGRQARVLNGGEAFDSAETEENDQIRKESIQAASNCDDIDQLDGREAGEEIQAKVIKSTSNAESSESSASTEGGCRTIDNAADEGNEGVSIDKLLTADTPTNDQRPFVAEYQD